MRFFALQGTLADLPGLSVFYQLAALGYSIPQISVVDALVNAGWFLRGGARPEWAVPVRALGVLTWLALAFLPFKELWMLASETCVAMHQGIMEKDGLMEEDYRRLTVGKIAGSLLGGLLLRHYSFHEVYLAEAALFFAVLVLGAAMPPVPRMRPPMKRGGADLQRFMTLVSLVPSVDTAVFFFAADVLGLQATDFALLEAGRTLAMVAGTYLRVPPELYLVCLLLGYLLLAAVLTRECLGYDYWLLCLRAAGMALCDASVLTQFTVAAERDVAARSRAPMAAGVAGFAASVALTALLGVDHGSYARINELVACAALASLLPVAHTLLCRAEPAGGGEEEAVELVTAQP
jgi:hypothetical protein